MDFEGLSVTYEEVKVTENMKREKKNELYAIFYMYIGLCTKQDYNRTICNINSLPNDKILD